MLFCVCYCMRQAKKHGKQADISEFRAQLDALGLKIIQVTADGNCFFRFVLSKIVLFLHIGCHCMRKKLHVEFGISNFVKRLLMLVPNLKIMLVWLVINE